MPVARLNGINIYYEDTGRGRPIVWSHGFACGAKMWQPQVDRLADRYRVVTYDVRVHGDSDSPAYSEAYTQPSSVEYLHQFLRHFCISGAFVG